MKCKYFIDQWKEFWWGFFEHILIFRQTFLTFITHSYIHIFNLSIYSWSWSYLHLYPIIHILHRYEVMCHCWLHSPDDRPSFTDLTAELDKRLEERSSEVCFIENLTSKAISSSMTQNKRQNKTSILSSYLGNYLCLVAYFWPQFQVIFAVILHRNLSKVLPSTLFLTDSLYLSLRLAKVTLILRMQKMTQT